MLKSHLLLFIHKLMIFALTTNAIIVFILYLLEFIVVYIFIAVECIFSNCIFTVFIGLVFISGFYIFIHVCWVGSYFLLFNSVL